MTTNLVAKYPSGYTIHHPVALLGGEIGYGVNNQQGQQVVTCSTYKGAKDYVKFCEAADKKALKNATPTTI